MRELFADGVAGAPDMGLGDAARRRRVAREGGLADLRVLQGRLFVERDQVAFVPFWWSDVQVQRALDEHWRRTMRKGFERRRTF